MVVMGYSFSLSGNFAEGLKWYDLAFELNPKVQNLYNGWCHKHLGNFEKAVEWANYNIENDPKNSIYYIDMSNATATLGLFDISKDYAKKALEINPGFKFAFESLSNNEYYQGNYLKSLKFALSSENEVTIGLIYYELDSLDQARNFLDARLTQGKPQNQKSQQQVEYYQALAHKALILLAIGDMESGRQLLESALPDIEEIGASKLEKWYLMAGYQASLGMPNEAIESFNKSIEYGFKRVFEARHNSLLDALGDNPEFQEIMAKLEKKNSLIREQVLAKGYFD
jgi:tetratricopeptide (TPR) repeat protein